MLHDLLPAAEILVALLLLVTLSIVILARYKKETMDALQRTGDVWKSEAEAAKAQVASNSAQLTEVRRGMGMMEKRVLMVEVDNERKTRLLHIARQEIEFLEDIVRIAVTADGGRLNKDLKAKIEERIQEFQRFRRDCYKRQEIWEEKQRVFAAYDIHRTVRPTDDLPDWDYGLPPEDDDLPGAADATDAVGADRSSLPGH